MVRLEIKLNAFHRSTIPQKQFIIIITKFVVEQEEHEKEDLQGRTFQ